MFNEVIDFIEKSAESWRNKLPSGASQTYGAGFDIGYALGHAHAYESVLNKIGVAPQKNAEVGEQQATIACQNAADIKVEGE